MTENLNVSTFRNGDLIPEAKSEEEWKIAGKIQTTRLVLLRQRTEKWS
jgi:hypothetical protein